MTQIARAYSRGLHQNRIGIAIQQLWKNFELLHRLTELHSRDSVRASANLDDALCRRSSNTKKEWNSCETLSSDQPDLNHFLATGSEKDRNEALLDKVYMLESRARVMKGAARR
jgi:hypothetical protein